MKRLILKKSLVILSFLLLLISQGCRMFSDMTHLSGDDMEWLEGLRDFMKFEYISNLNNTDTVMTTNYHVHNDICPVYVCSENLETYTAGAGINYSMFNSKNEHSGFSFYIYRPINNRDSLHFDITSDPFRLRGEKIGLQRAEQNIYRGDFIFKGKQYNDCVIVENTYPAELFPFKSGVKYIDKIVMHKGLGLIYYRYVDGEEFFFKRIIKSK